MVERQDDAIEIAVVWCGRKTKTECAIFFSGCRLQAGELAGHLFGASFSVMILTDLSVRKHRLRDLTLSFQQFFLRRDLYREIGFAHRLDVQKMRVVAAHDVDRAPGKTHDVGCHLIHEGTVMRHEKTAAAILFEPVFEITHAG